MTLKFKTAGAWGAGTGSPLSAADCDSNIYQLDQRIADVEATSHRSIVSLATSGLVGTFTYSDGSTETFDIPTTEQVPATPITVTGATLTLGIEHANMYLRFTHAGGCVVTLDNSDNWIAGTEVHLRAVGGPVSLSYSPSVTAVHYPTIFAPSCSIVHGTMSLKVVGADEWDLFGLLDLAV